MVAQITVGAQTLKKIPPEAGQLTPSLIEDLKASVLDELTDSLMSFIEAADLIRWNIDSEKRTLSAKIELEVYSNDGEGDGES